MEESSEQRVGEDGPAHLDQLAIAALSACMRGEAIELDDAYRDIIVANRALIGEALSQPGVEIGDPTMTSWFQKIKQAINERDDARQDGLGHGRPDNSPHSPKQHRA